MNPIDVVWRRDFGIPYGSPDHLNASFIDQLIWYEEKRLVEQRDERSGSEGVASQEAEEVKGGGEGPKKEPDKGEPMEMTEDEIKEFMQND